MNAYIESNMLSKIDAFYLYRQGGDDAMKTITVRGLDDGLSEKLKQKAKKDNKSVNQFVVDSIKSVLGAKKEKKFTMKYHDMDHLFGKWSQEEFDVIQGQIDSDRKIDKELWK
jgi:hypothetical protein